jgi:hypothetical protein
LVLGRKGTTVRDFPEADWRILRELGPIALERFCKRVLEKAAALVNGSPGDAGGCHDRYLALYKLIRDQDKELGYAFNDICRSTAQARLISIRNLELLTDAEFMRFSEKTRESVVAFLELSNRRAALPTSE